MSERTDQGAPVGPLTSVLRHPAIIALCLVVGLALGIAASVLTPTTHTAETRVSVVPANTNAYTIAGYPVGARELASDYARWVQNRAVDGEWAPPGSSSVSASPIPDAAVIRIEVDADSPENATNGARQVADTLMSTVAEAREGHSPEAAYAEFQQYAPQVAEARADVATAERAYNLAIGQDATTAVIEERRQALAEAQTTLAERQLQQDAAGDLYRRLYADTAGNSTLEVTAEAALVGDGARAEMIRFGLVGLGAGALLGMLLAVLVDNRRHRRERRVASAPAARPAEGEAA